VKNSRALPKEMQDIVDATDAVFRSNSLDFDAGHIRAESQGRSEGFYIFCYDFSVQNEGIFVPALVRLNGRREKRQDVHAALEAKGIIDPFKNAIG
jgi:hypothetical protein